MAYPEIISIIIPTFRRNDGVLKTLKSLRAQSGISDIDIEIIVSDNNPDRNAQDTVTRFTDTSPVPVHYVHAAIPGVSNARNAAVSAAKGRYIAFLDDDQYAAPNWLGEMLRTLREHDLAAVFCKTEAIVDESSAYAPYFKSFFSRDFPELSTGPVGRFFGAGNSMIDRAKVTLPDPVFDPAMNQTGGEDDVFFSNIMAQGGRMGWTCETQAFEDIPAARQTAAYVRVRSFAHGQGPTRQYADLGPFNPLGITKWMVIGAGQFLVFAPLALAFRVLKPSVYPRYLAKAAAGAGKVLWQKPFRPKLYGA